MKMKIWKRLSVLALCVALCGGTALAANTVYRTITVQYTGIKLVIDGVEVIPKDANGMTVEPFIYNGTTYLPVRAVGNAIGKQVSWDGDTQTVYLGEVPSNQNWLLDVCPPYQSQGLVTYQTDFKMDGNTYTHGFYSMYSFYGCFGLFNLNGEYATLSCDIGHIQGEADKNGQIEIFLDGELSQVIEIPSEALVKHYDIPLHNALQLKIVPSSDIGFANCELS